MSMGLIDALFDGREGDFKTAFEETMVSSNFAPNRLALAVPIFLMGGILSWERLDTVYIFLSNGQPTTEIFHVEQSLSLRIYRSGQNGDLIIGTTNPLLESWSQNIYIHQESVTHENEPSIFHLPDSWEHENEPLIFLLPESWETCQREFVLLKIKPNERALEIYTKKIPVQTSVGIGSHYLLEKLGKIKGRFDRHWPQFLLGQQTARRNYDRTIEKLQTIAEKEEFHKTSKSKNFERATKWSNALMNLQIGKDIIGSIIGGDLKGVAFTTGFLIGSTAMSKIGELLIKAGGVYKSVGRLALGNTMLIGGPVLSRLPSAFLAFDLYRQ
uniref:Uncharacterized protein n=1 Tax=Romanomermis culicivorax TaxID=13658 RepID=A0A915IIL6_ROMCU